jgi:hypothetical protein
VIALRLLLRPRCLKPPFKVGKYFLEGFPADQAISRNQIMHLVEDRFFAFPKHAGKSMCLAISNAFEVASSQN